MKIFSIIIFIIGVVLLIPSQVSAGAFEVSAGLNFSKSNYSEANYYWSRRWGTSFGYHFTDQSEIEIAFQDVVDRTLITGYQDTTFHDQVYSVNWVQALTGKKFFIQPYVKGGIGQLNRSATGRFSSGASPPLVVDAVTGVLGTGARIYLTRSFALRVEGTSYLAGGNISTWKKNFSIIFGVSFLF